VECSGAMESSLNKLLDKNEPPDEMSSLTSGGSDDHSETGNLSPIPETNGEEDEEMKLITGKHLVKPRKVASEKGYTSPTSESQEKAYNAFSETEHTFKTYETESSTSDEFEESGSTSSSKCVRFSFDSCTEGSESGDDSSYLSEQDEHSNAMMTLFHLLTSKNDKAAENRQAALRMGAPVAVVRAMRENKRQVAIQKYACRCLAAISWNKEAADQVLEAGGLEAALCAFYQFPNNIALQRSSCKLIGNLWKKFPKTSSDNTFRTRQRIVDEGGLMAVIDAMTCHPKNRDVQRWGCYALQSLLRNGSSFAEAAAMAGGIDLVISAMNNHLNGNGDRELQLDACRFLYRVAKDNEEFRDKIVQAKGLVAIGEAFRVHDKDANLKDLVCKSMKVLVGIS
jgi:hypothetical protein